MENVSEITVLHLFAHFVALPYPKHIFIEETEPASYIAVYCRGAYLSCLVVGTGCIFPDKGLNDFVALLDFAVLYTIVALVGTQCKVPYVVEIAAQQLQYVARTLTARLAFGCAVIYKSDILGALQETVEAVCIYRVAMLAQREAECTAQVVRYI